MNEKNFIKCIAVISAQYEKFKVMENKMLFEIWLDAFKDEDDGMFEMAVKTLLHTYEYNNPTIANLNHILADLKNPVKLLPGDIWDEIQKSIRKFGSYRDQEAYETLSDVAKQTVDSLGGFKTLCLTEDIMATRAHGLKIATQFIERDSKLLLTTNSMKKEQLENQERMLQLTNNIGKKV